MPAILLRTAPSRPVPTPEPPKPVPPSPAEQPVVPTEPAKSNLLPTARKPDTRTESEKPVPPPAKPAKPVPPSPVVEPSPVKPIEKAVEPTIQPALPIPVVQPALPTAVVSPAPPTPTTPVLHRTPTRSEPLVIAAKPQDDVDKGRGTKKSVDSDEIKERLEQMKDAETLLRRILKGFPANCVTAEVVGTPRPVKQDDQKVTVRVKVKLSVDEMALAAFRKRLLLVLDEFKEESWDETWKFERQPGQSPESTRKGAVQADAEYARVNEKGDKGRGKTVTDEIAVYVNTKRNEDWTSLKWQAYALDQMLTGVFDDATGRHGECVLSIFSKAGDTIPVDRFPLGDERLGATTPIADRTEFGDGGRTFFISSTFLRDAPCTKHAPSVTVVREVEMPLSLLDRLQALKCETRYVSGGGQGK